MKLLALSGSARSLSTNSALLRELAAQAPAGLIIDVYDQIASLPIFSPDLDSGPKPPVVADFIARIAACDGLLIACPEYVRTLPGGFKNALDWLVSGNDITFKPVALAHASHRGDDMLATLRLVLQTVTTRFADDIFLRIPLTRLTPAEVTQKLTLPDHRAEIARFLARFRDFCRAPLPD
jgi:NAD(P)H-dependent FMN reductase